MEASYQPTVSTKQSPCGCTETTIPLCCINNHATRSTFGPRNTVRVARRHDRSGPRAARCRVLRVARRNQRNLVQQLLRTSASRQLFGSHRCPLEPTTRLGRTTCVPFSLDMRKGNSGELSGNADKCKICECGNTLPQKC